WHEENLPNGQKILKTLFVKLKNPPKTIKLNGLPENVVPIARQKKTMDDSQVAIVRHQIPILPNFGMTDYCSQGRTRPINPVHLKYCWDHRSYYTALSRGSTYDGTLIVDFQDILDKNDDITKHRYYNQLPDEVCGSFRFPLLKSFRDWKKKADANIYNPPNIHNAIAWIKQEDFQLDEENNTALWKYLSKSKQDKNTLEENNKNKIQDATNSTSRSENEENSNTPKQQSKNKRKFDEDPNTKQRKKQKI
ncbi:hypothetical protein JAAARDRAFT_109642, partial [Jaapia argillacea MUCL 33604]